MNSLEKLTTLILQLTKKANTLTLTKADLEFLQAETQATENNILASSLSYPEPWQSSQYLHIQADRIVDLDNELYAATENKEALLPYCRLLHGLNHRLLRNVNLSAYDDAPLSDSFRTMTAGVANNRWASIRQELEKHGCSPALLDLSEKPLNLLSALHVRYRLHDHRYLEMYLEELEKVSRTVTTGEPNSDPETPLIEALIHMDMNSSRVFTYIANKLNAALTQLDTPEERMQWLDEQERYFGQFGLISSLAYRLEGIGLLDELKGWLMDRLEGIWLMRDEEDDEMNIINDHVIKRNMNVTELAVFEKMLYDLGLTTEQSLNTLSVKLSKNFASRDRDHLQAHSILKKFHVREEFVKFTLQGWLRDMGEWLGRNMN